MALVCLDDRYCFRIDESGNVDPSMVPWLPEQGP